MSYSNLSKTLPADLTGTRRFNGVSGRLFTGTANPADNDEAMVHVVLVDQNNTPLVSRVDMDSGAGTAYRTAVGLLVAASGGPALVPGDATNGLKVQLASAAPVAVSGTFWQATQPVSGTFWQATQPVSGTFWQATQPVSLASVPSHPVTNAGTFPTQSTLQASTAVIGKTLSTEVSVPISVASGQTLSGAIDSAGYTRFGVWVPATFDGTTMDFQVSHSGAGGTYLPLYTTANVLFSITVSPSRAYTLPDELRAWRYFALNCGTAQAGTSTDFFVTMRS